jgi:drug/metabolite transporter (DMT)-like permease
MERALTANSFAKPMSAGEWSMLLALSAIWGCTFFLVAIALRELPFAWVALARVGLAALMLHAVVLARGIVYPREPRAWGRFLLMGLVNNAIPFGLIFWAQTHIASGLAAILNASTPVFAMVLAHFATRDDRLSARRLLGVLIGVAGVAAMMGLQALEGLGTEFLAQLAVLGAGLSYAIAGLYGRRFAGTPPTMTAAGQMTGSTVLLLPAALFIAPPATLSLPGPTTWTALIALAGICTAVGYLIYFRILATAGATNLLLTTLLIPVGAVLLGTGVLGETLLARHLAGMALIAAGLIVIDGRAVRLFRLRPNLVPPPQRDDALRRRADAGGR